MIGCSIISQEYRKLVGWYWTMMRRQLFTLASSIRCIYTINPGVTCCVITVTLWSLRSSPSSDQYMSIWVRLSPPPASPGTLLWVDPFWWSWWAATDWRPNKNVIKLSKLVILITKAYWVMFSSWTDCQKIERVNLVAQNCKNRDKVLGGLLVEF